MPFYPDLLKYRDRPAAVSDCGARITYSELAEFSRSVAALAPPRSLAFVLCENSIGSLAGCVAFLESGVVPLLLDAMLDRRLLAGLLEIYQPEYLYLPARLRGEFAGYACSLESHGYLLLRTPWSSSLPLYDGLGLLITTSGSTGSPKLVRLSYANLRGNGESIVQYLQLGPEERPITTLPMHYSYGFSIVNSHLLAGGTLLLTTKSLVEKGFWEFFRREEATSFGGVPYTFEMLKRLRFSRLELPSLRTMTQAGGRLAPELCREFAEYAAARGIRFFVMYGQTEATARMSYLPSELALAKCGSVGIAIPGGAFSLVDDEGAAVEGGGGEGELVYRGPNVSLGYAERRADLALGDERGGVLYTGDMARRDEEGFYYITGRRRRFIKLFGNRVNLDEAESLLKGVVPECACSGSDDRMVIYLTEEGRESEVRQFVSAITGIHHSAFTVKVVDAIPKTSAGKTSYAELT